MNFSVSIGITSGPLKILKRKLDSQARRGQRRRSDFGEAQNLNFGEATHIGEADQLAIITFYTN